MAKPRINIEWIIEKYLPYFQTFQVTEETLRAYYEEYKQKQPKAGAGDFLWNVFQLINKAIDEQTKTEEQRYRLNVEVNSKMWEYLVREENRNGNHVKRIMHENQLRLWQIQETRWKQEIHIISGHCCHFCDNLNDIVMSIKEALEAQPLASKQCTREWGCNCTYSVVASRNKNGELILI